MAQLHVLVQELVIAAENNINDISSFLRNRMSEIRSFNRSFALAADWPEDEAIHALARRTAGLFVWASTACRSSKVTTLGGL